jgi:hypothetical protein
LLAYVDALKAAYPHDTLTVVLPEYIPSRWWEQLLHNHTAFRLRLALMFHPGVVTVSVPYHLGPIYDRSSQPSRQRQHADHPRTAAHAPHSPNTRGEQKCALWRRAVNWSDVGPPRFSARSEAGTSTSASGLPLASACTRLRNAAESSLAT